MMQIFKIKLVLILFLVLKATITFGQDSNSIIEGYIYDEESGEALPGVNVYLSGTRIGDDTNVKGYFSIENIPEGYYEMVISHIGYGVYHDKMHIEKDDTIFVERYLESKRIDLENITVKGEIDREWKRNLGRFIKYFVGESRNAAQTTIENPEVLDFETGMGSILKADTDRKLHIRNESLGYLLKIDLTHFEWNYIKDSGSTLYFSQFEELTSEDEKEKRKWEKNRRETYQFSPQRFFSHLANNTHEKHYEISGGRLNPPKHDENQSYSLFEETNIVSDYRVSLAFPHDNLTIFIEEKETGYIQPNEEKEPKVRWLKIDRYGNLHNPLDFTLGGIWKNYRIADKLPLNYGETGN